MTNTTPQPAASANYMALITSKEGAFAPNVENLRSRVIHLEPTLSYAIAWAGYEETHELLHDSMQGALDRLKARQQAILFPPKLNVQEAWRLRDDVEQFDELLEAMAEALNDLKQNKSQFEMDIHMSVVEMVRVRWELEGCEF